MPSHKLFTRFAMPRNQFIGDAPDPLGDDSLATILDNYDKLGFVRWVKSNKDIHYNDLDIWISGLDPEDKLIYSKLLKDCSHALSSLVKISPSGGYVPLPMCPSAIGGETGIHVPSEMVLQWPAEILVDEYFGLCYHPDREGDGRFSRFDAGLKEALKAKIKASIPDVKDILESRDVGIESGISVTDPQALVDIYGERPLENWWKTLSESDLTLWLDGYNFGSETKEFWYRWFIEKWGGEVEGRPPAD